MADLTLVTANRGRIVDNQFSMRFTAPASVAITALQAVRLDTATGKWVLADATAAPNARIFGVATRTVVAGEALTVVRKGPVDGYNLTALAYDADVFLSNTAGALADAAGTVSVKVGRVVSAWAVSLGTAADKLLYVDL